MSTDAEKVVKALRQPSIFLDGMDEDTKDALADFVERGHDIRHGSDYATAEWWEAARNRYDAALARLREVLS